VTQGYRTTRFYLTVYGLSSHLAETQRSKDAHPVWGGGRNKRKLNRLDQKPPQIPSHCREEDGMGPVRGFIETNARRGGDTENLVCLL